MYKLFLFDLDGILRRALKFIDIFKELYGLPYEKTIPYINDHVIRCIETGESLLEPTEKLIEENGLPDEPKVFFHKWFSCKSDINWDLLAHIKIKKDVCVLATNQPLERWEFLLKEMQLEDHFSKMYSSNLMQTAKPNPEYFKRIITDFSNVKPEEMIFFDDRQENIDSAKSCGIEAVLCLDYSLVNHTVLKYLNQ